MTFKQLNEGLDLMQEITRIGKIIEDIRRTVRRIRQWH